MSKSHRAAPRTRRPARGKVAAAVKALAETASAKTIIYVHGIGNKPRESVLKCQWDHALFGFDLGERSRLAYWVNRDYYPTPVAATCASGDYTELEQQPTGRSLSLKQHLRTTSLQQEAEAITTEPREQQVLISIAEKIEEPAVQRLRRRATAVEAEGIDAQFFLFEWITRGITRAFMRDVHDFLFVEERRTYMAQRLTERLDAGGGPFVVIGHSQGSMVAYDVLARAKGKYDVPLFVTIGSPLGLAEVKNRLKDFTGGALRVPAGIGRWLNVADGADPVAFDENLSDDYAPKGTVDDVQVRNPDAPKHPHSGSGYLRTAVVRKSVQQAVDTELFQRIAPFTIARNLARELEDARPARRSPVLVQLTDVTTGAAAAAKNASTLPEARRAVVDAIASISGLTQDDPALRLEVMQRYVSADLTRSEVERLAADAALGSARLLIDKLWKNERKRALLDQSAETVHAVAARNSYGALGRGIVWAVLDSGVAAKHPHFRDRIEGLFDCTQRGAVVDGTATDENGHGSHVAGIIAGRHTARGSAGDTEITGIAPDARLRIYKVLDADGSGDDAWIIKALDHIADANERSGSLRIQGVNLSLGGPFDQSTFACGHTPLCSELRRLWRQGVVVVLAAGNEGFFRLLTEDGPFDANLDLSIADPANLEEAIAVGSTHRGKPHTYGVSFFSSRGPTADGRQKPDLVAPGEKVLSCRHDFVARGTALSDFYVRMSGTSMAAPHVSGLLAAYLSARQEFIGQPERVKQILLANCIDLSRDRSQQGAGLPNLMKMLMNS